MKKSIASALTAAVVLGIASTTFAAPLDDEVAALKARVAELERIIREQNNSTANNRRDVADLDSRVTDLERTGKDSWVNKFKLNGELRARYWHVKDSPDFSRLEIRLLPTFTIDEHLAVKARFTGTYNNFHDDNSAAWATNFAYLEAKYNNFQLNAGKLPLFTNVDQGLVADSFFSGAQAIFGGQTKFTVNAGRWSGAGNYIGAEVQRKFNDSFNAGIGYHYFKERGVDNKESIITGGLGYKFNKDFGLFGAVAHNTKAESKKTAYNIEANYKGANRNVKSSWGAYVAYRYAPSTVSLAPTYDTYGRTTGKKGFELGATWTPYKNTLTKIAYFHGKTFSDVNDRTFFARASVFF
jgi:hypothetical protein